MRAKNRGEGGTKNREGWEGNNKTGRGGGEQKTGRGGRGTKNREGWEGNKKRRVGGKQKNRREEGVKTGSSGRGGVVGRSWFRALVFSLFFGTRGSPALVKAGSTRASNALEPCTIRA